MWFLALPSLHPSTFLENVFHTCLCAFVLYHTTIHVQEVVTLQVKPTPLVYRYMYDSIIMFVEAQNLDFSYLGSIFG